MPPRAWPPGRSGRSRLPPTTRARPPSRLPKLRQPSPRARRRRRPHPDQRRPPRKSGAARAPVAARDRRRLWRVPRSPTSTPSDRRPTNRSGGSRAPAALRPLCRLRSGHARPRRRRAKPRCRRLPQSRPRCRESPPSTRCRRLRSRHRKVQRLSRRLQRQARPTACCRFPSAYFICCGPALSRLPAKRRVRPCRLRLRRADRAGRIEQDCPNRLEGGLRVFRTNSAGRDSVRHPASVLNCNG